MKKFDLNHALLTEKLRKHAPKIFDLVFSMDMGYEFSAILQEGVIFAEPGMLLEHSEGYLPADEWREDPPKVFEKKFRLFLQDFEDITPYHQISNEELIDLLDEVENK